MLGVSGRGNWMASASRQSTAQREEPACGRKLDPIWYCAISSLHQIVCNPLRNRPVMMDAPEAPAMVPPNRSRRIVWGMVRIGRAPSNLHDTAEQKAESSGGATTSGVNRPLIEAAAVGCGSVSSRFARFTLPGGAQATTVPSTAMGSGPHFAGPERQCRQYPIQPSASWMRLRKSG